MKIQTHCLIICLIFPIVSVTEAATPNAQRVWSKALTKEIAGLERRFKGRISIYVSEPNLGLEFSYDADRPSYIASGVKVPFMIEVFRQAEQGLLSMDEGLVYRQEDLRDGSPRLRRHPLGSRIKIRDLVHLMVQNSDNAASDMLVKRVGLENINRGLRAQGFQMDNPLISLLDVRRAVFRELDVRADDLTNLEIRTIRWTWGWRSHVRKLEEILGRPPGTYSKNDLHAAYRRFYATGVNHVRVSTLGKIMEALVAGTLVSGDASAQMFKIMSDAKTSTNRMMGLLPRGTRVAHKTGSQWERICDYGVITLPNKNPLIFAGCLADGNDRKLAEQTLAKIARKAYDLARQTYRKQASRTK